MKNRKSIEDVTFETIYRNGRPMWLASDGTIIPKIMGGEGEETPEEKRLREANEAEAKKPKFSQEEVGALISKASSKEVEKILKALGVEKVEDAQAIITAAKEAESKNLTDKEKAEKDAKEAKDAATGAANDLAALQLTTKVEKALIKAGLAVEAAERVRKLVEVDAKADDAAITTAIEALKKDMPNLFTPVAGGSTLPPPPGTPSKKVGKDGDPAVQAAALLAERHPNRNQHLKDKQTT